MMAATVGRRKKVKRTRSPTRTGHPKERGDQDRAKEYRAPLPGRREAAETPLGRHGGPGADCGYMRPLSVLADDDLRVVVDRPARQRQVRRTARRLRLDRGAASWTSSTTCAGASKLGRDHLGLGTGGAACSALQYALDRPRGVASLILSNTAASIPAALTEYSTGSAPLSTLRPRRPSSATKRLRIDENPSYLAAVDELYIRHLWRPHPWEYDRALREGTRRSADDESPNMGRRLPPCGDSTDFSLHSVRW